MILGWAEGKSRVKSFTPRSARLTLHAIHVYVNRRGGRRRDFRAALGRGRGAVTLAIRIPTELACYMVSKGSIAVDGVSLTVVEAEPDRFTVALVPFTIRHTTLGGLRRGARVNIETDLLARHAEKVA